MTLADRLSQPDDGLGVGPRGRKRHPSGWEPGIDTAKGQICARTDDADGPDWTHVLQNLGLDPDDWEVVDGQAEVRTWDVPGHGRMYYHKAKVRPSREAADLDLEQLAAKVRKRGPLQNALQPPSGDGGWLVVCLGDTQAGKGTRGGATLLVDRLERLGAAVETRAKELAKVGRDVPNLALLLTGDLVENCTGAYAMQDFEVELDMRQQVKLMRRMVVELLDRWAVPFERIYVAAAAGNHGEKRKNGKAYTSWSDNYDLEIPEQVAEILQANPDRYAHVQFLLPDPDRLTVQLELDGLRVGVAHGHQCRTGGSTVQQKVLKWWTKMTATRALDCDVLCVGHFHHHEMHTDGTADGGFRTYMQCPALDGGSPWWEQTGGGWTDAGVLTFRAAAGRWSDLHIIPAD